MRAQVLRLPILCAGLLTLTACGWGTLEPPDAGFVVALPDAPVCEAWHKDTIRGRWESHTCRLDIEPALQALVWREPRQYSVSWHDLPAGLDGRDLATVLRELDAPGLEAEIPVLSEARRTATCGERDEGQATSRPASLGGVEGLERETTFPGSLAGLLVRERLCVVKHRLYVVSSGGMRSAASAREWARIVGSFALASEAAPLKPQSSPRQPGSSPMWALLMGAVIMAVAVLLLIKHRRSAVEGTLGRSDRAPEAFDSLLPLENAVARLTGALLPFRIVSPLRRGLSGRVSADSVRLRWRSFALDSGLQFRGHLESVGGGCVLRGRFARSLWLRLSLWAFVGIHFLLGLLAFLGSGPGRLDNALWFWSVTALGCGMLAIHWLSGRRDEALLRSTIATCLRAPPG